jgi:beta-glucosidase
MPYYTVSWDQDPSGENVGNSYNKYIIDSLLRKQYGFEGIVCTDWGIVPDYNMDPLTTGGKCYGVEDRTIGERIFKILDAGVDQMGGSVNAGQIMQAYQIWVEKYGEQSARERWEASAKRILIGFFRIGLFENPYVDPENADKVLNDPELHSRGESAQSKSVVMVKNVGGTLPLDKKMKVYVPLRNIPGVYSMTGRQKKAPYVGYSVDTAEVAKRYTIVDTPEQADFAIVAITEPEGGIGYSKADVKAGGNGYLPISLQYSPYTATYARQTSIAGGDPAEKFTNRSYKGKSITVENQTDLALVRETKAAMGDKPVIVLLSTTRPVVMEFEPWADAILVAFGVRSAAYLDIITGSKEPYGLLPMQFPIDMKTVEQQFEDTPHDMTPYLDACGNRYDFAFGMNWSGVINDARVKKYKK